MNNKQLMYKSICGLVFFSCNVSNPKNIATFLGDDGDELHFLVTELG